MAECWSIMLPAEPRRAGRFLELAGAGGGVLDFLLPVGAPGAWRRAEALNRRTCVDSRSKPACADSRSTRARRSGVRRNARGFEGNPVEQEAGGRGGD